MISSSPLRVFRVPIALAVLTAVGLLSALLGDEQWDVLSWLALAVPIAAATWAYWRPIEPTEP